MPVDAFSGIGNIPVLGGTHTHCHLEHFAQQAGRQTSLSPFYSCRNGGSKKHQLLVAPHGWSRGLPGAGPWPCQSVLLSKFWAVPGQLSQNCEDTAPSSGLHAAGRSCAGAAAAREEGASSAPALTSPAEGPGHWLLDPPIFPLSHGSYNYIILTRKETYHLNKLSLQRGHYWTQSGDGTSKVTQRVTCE